MTAPNSQKIPNYTATQNAVDGLTLGTPSTGVASGDNVSLVLNDATSASAANTTGTGTTPTVTTPSLPSSGTAQTNSTGSDVNVYIYGGTISEVQVGPSASLVEVGTTDGAYYVPAGQQIKVTYSVAPTWVWQAENGVAPAGYALALVNGVPVKIPYFTF